MSLSIYSLSETVVCPIAILKLDIKKKKKTLLEKECCPPFNPVNNHLCYCRVILYMCPFTPYSYREFGIVLNVCKLQTAEMIIYIYPTGFKQKTRKIFSVLVFTSLMARHNVKPAEQYMFLYIAL